MQMIITSREITRTLYLDTHEYFTVPHNASQMRVDIVKVNRYAREGTPAPVAVTLIGQYLKKDGEPGAIRLKKLIDLPVPHRDRAALALDVFSHPDISRAPADVQQQTFEAVKAVLA